MNEYSTLSAPTFSSVLQPQRVQKRKKLDNWESYSSDTNKHERVFVTHVRATVVVSDQHRTRASFYVVVKINGRKKRALNKPILVGEDAVEWDEEILLPSERSSSISFKVYTSPAQVGAGFGSRELLGTFNMTMGDVLDLCEQLQTVRLLARGGDGFLSSSSSLRIIAERRTFVAANKSTTRFNLSDSCGTGQLMEFTDAGHQALTQHNQLRNQRDLDKAIAPFERVPYMCSPDNTSHATTLSNLAATHCQANNDHLALDESVTLYRNALELYPASLPDCYGTAFNLGSALLVRYERRGNEADRMEAKDLLSRVVELSSVESYAHRAASLVLQMAEIPVEVQKAGSGISPTNVSNPDDQELIRTARAVWLDLPGWDLRPPGSWLCVERLLCRRFDCSDDPIQVREAFLILEYVVAHTSDGHPDKPAWLSVLGCSLLRRFEHLGNLTDVNDSVSMAEGSLHLTPDGHPDKSARLSSLARSLRRRFQRTGDLMDINRSVSMLEEALRFTPDGHFDRPTRLHNLASSLFRLFERLGDLTDLERSISTAEEALHLTPHSHPDRLARLKTLGRALTSRFERLGQPMDINTSISRLEEAVCLTSDGHPDKPGRLKCLGSALYSRFKRLNDLVDLNRSISAEEQAVRQTPDHHFDKSARLNNLGNSLSARFQRLGDLADIDKSISVLEEALRLTPDDHPHKPTMLQNLGRSLSDRFQRLGNLADITKSIVIKEEAVRLTPNNHPKRPGRLNSLATSLHHRFKHLGDLADINKSISMEEEALSFTPDGHPSKPTRLMSLGTSLCLRFERAGDLADINKSILTLGEAVRLTPDGHPHKLARLNSLGSSLFRRFERLGDPADINKSISIGEEALSLCPDDHPDKSAWLSGLGSSLLSRFERLGDIMDINYSISVKEEAVRLTPIGHPRKPAWLNNLGISLYHRYEHTSDLADVNRAISLFEEAISLTPDGHPDKLAWMNNLGSSLSRRFDHLDDLTDLNKSISVNEEAVRLASSGRAEKPAWLSNLGSSLVRRWQRLGDLDDLIKSILMSEDAVRLTANGDARRAGRLNTLGNLLCCRFEHLGDIRDINKSISVLEEVVCCTADHHPSKSRWLNNLGIALCRRFQHSSDLADINKSISMFEEAGHLSPDGHPEKPAGWKNLGVAFMLRFKHSRDPLTLSAAVSNFSQASRAPFGPTSTRFRAAQSWISSARLQGHSGGILDAYTTAIGLLPELAWIGSSLSERHRVLLEAADVARDAAAVALVASLPEKAVEWLEQGRSVVWGQFLQLRTPVDELRIEHSALADRFQRTSQELECASRRDNVAFQGLADEAPIGARSLEKEVQRHHDLALTREKLLTEIRSLPGFERFLLPKMIGQLAALAHSGPVVYLNASKHRCDALVVAAASGNVIPISFPDIRYSDVEQLHSLLRLLLKQNRFIISRDDISALVRSEEDPASKHVFDTLLEEDGIEGGDRAAKVKPQRVEGYTGDELFQRVLSYLWKEIVKPVLDALGLSNLQSRAEKMTHIFWCPTGPLAFMPIHAAGLYGTAKPGTKLSDFAISSYIPTLSSLAPSSRKGPSPTIRLVTVPQPPTDGQGFLALVGNEIDQIKTLSSRSPHVTLQDSDGTVEDVMEKMANSDWVHFACHGIQDPDDPLDSGLCLADSRRLKLSDIVRLSHPQGGLAFLSACQTAQGDEKLSEESVHLAAGMLLAGYGGVIATMWAIQDPDAPKVTKDVYEHLFRDGKVPDCTETAEALHYAVQHLRDSGVPFTSWVPFIHVGR